MPDRPREELRSIKRWMTKGEHEALMLDETLNDLERMAVRREDYLSEEAILLD